MHLYDYSFLLAVHYCCRLLPSPQVSLIQVHNFYNFSMQLNVESGVRFQNEPTQHMSWVNKL